MLCKLITCDNVLFQLIVELWIGLGSHSLVSCMLGTCNVSYQLMVIGGSQNLHIILLMLLMR